MTGGPVWSDLRCPECGAQTYGPIGQTGCEMGHERVTMRAATKADWCGEAAPEKAASKGVQPCCCPPGHEGPHVWWLNVGHAGGRFMAVWFYRQTDSGAEPVFHADLRGPGGFSQEEAAALWQTVELAWAKRSAAQQAAERRTHNPGQSG